MLELEDFSTFYGKMAPNISHCTTLQSSSIINSVHLLLLLQCRLWQNLLNSNTAKPLNADILMNVQLPFPVLTDCCSVKFWEKEKNPCMDSLH